MRVHISFTVVSHAGQAPHAEGLQFGDLQMPQALATIGVLERADNVADLEVRYVGQGDRSVTVYTSA